MVCLSPAARSKTIYGSGAHFRFLENRKCAPGPFEDQWRRPFNGKLGTPLPRVFHITNEYGSMRHECETANVMSALVKSMHGLRMCRDRDHEWTCDQVKTQNEQDETTKQLPQKIAKYSFTQSRVNTQPQLRATLSPTRERKAAILHWHPRDLIAACAAHTRPSTESRALLTNQTCTWYVLFCPSFTQRCSNVVLPFLHTVRTFPSC